MFGFLKRSLRSVRRFFGRPFLGIFLEICFICCIFLNGFELFRLLFFCEFYILLWSLEFLCSLTLFITIKLLVCIWVINGTFLPFNLTGLFYVFINYVCLFTFLKVLKLFVPITIWLFILLIIFLLISWLLFDTKFKLWIF
jgi:hypothetical protein